MRLSHSLAAALTIIASVALGQSTTPRADDDLLGLWGTEATIGPPVRGELLLTRDARAWIARIGGFEAAALALAQRDSIRVELPGGRGQFRGRLDRDGVVRGFWIQPPGGVPPYASPVVLRASGPGAWRGSVVPRDERISMYLLIKRAADGSLRGGFQNPEFGFTGNAPWFRVRKEGEQLALSDTSRDVVRYRQPYDSSQRRILMDFGASIALRPTSAPAAVGYYPRSSAELYEYRPPAPRGDGWTTARASSVGLDEASLQALVRLIARIDPTIGPGPRVHSVLVARRGRLVLEEYFFGYSADRMHDLRSASKTITSLMAGIAMDRGALTVDTPVYSLFGQPADERKRRITIAHLLTHSSGLACDDNDDRSPGNENAMQRQGRQSNWYRYTLDLDAIRDPGTLYAYCSGGINLVGAAIAASTKTWLPDFFDRYVARPLGIERYHMNLMPDLQGYSGGGLHMLPRDLMKIGQLYLAGGTWKGRRVVSKSWVDRSTAHQIDAPNQTSDGYGWHRYRLSANGREYQEYEANGNGGQFLIVVPELELVVVFTGGNYNQYGLWRTFRDDLVPRYILSAIARTTHDRGPAFTRSCRSPSTSGVARSGSAPRSAHRPAAS